MMTPMRSISSQPKTAGQVLAAQPRLAREVRAAPVAAAKNGAAAALGLVLCLGTISAADVALAYNPVATTAGVEERIVKGEGPGLGSYVQEDVEGPLKPPGKKTIEKAESKGAEAVQNVVSASGVKPFTTGVTDQVEKSMGGAVENLDPSAKNFVESLTEKVEATTQKIGSLFGQ